MADYSDRSLSSSSEEASEYHVSDDEDEEEDDDEITIISTSSDDDDRGDDDGSELSDAEADHESVDEDSEVTPAEEAHCDRVTHLLQDGGDLSILKLEECKAYLRKHGLRITGTKAICIQRILEHWRSFFFFHPVATMLNGHRIKDGTGEKLYPRSSFVINCTGDVCMGDVVLFTQRVYDRFDKVTRGGNPLGKRTIAGRIVKESYGARKQQHTFTVEILWSKGVKRLPPLFPLLVKGRNLYRLKTYRQGWSNEGERKKVLAEKHKRGAAARRTREVKKARRDSKRPRHSCHSRPSPKRQRAERMGSDMDRRRGKAKKPKVSTLSVSVAAARHVQNTSQPYGVGAPIPTSYYGYRPFFPREDCRFGNYDASSSSTAKHFVTGHIYANPIPSTYNDTRVRPQMGLKPLGGMQRNGGNSLPCSTLGCHGLGAKSCIYSFCGKCCTRIGRKCKRHQL